MMVEFIARLALAGALVGSGAFIGPEEFAFVWRVALLFATYSGIAYLLERRGMRNPGVSGFVAVADAALIAYLVARFGVLERYAFLVLAPCAFAAARHGSNSAAMAPIAAAWLLVAANLSTRMPPSGPLLVQVLAVLAVGLLMNQARIVMTVTREIEVPIVPPTEGPEPVHFMELRENFRRLRDHCRDVEHRSRRDRTSMALYEAVRNHSGRAYTRLAQALREVTGAEAVSLHTASAMGDMMIVRGVSGPMPEDLHSTAFAIGQGLSEYQQRSRMDQLLAAIRDPEARQASGSVLLKDRGRLVGMIGLVHTSVEGLDESIAKVEEAMPMLVSLLREEDQREAARRRLSEMETLYGIATVMAGAETPTTLAARVVRELADSLPLQHLSVHALDGSEAILLASAGPAVRLEEQLEFEGGTGVEAWKRAGATELHIPDVPGSGLVDRTIALKKRTGSFCLIPLRFGREPYGYLTASANAVGGLDEKTMATLRATASELSRAIGRLEGAQRGAEGLANPREFQSAVSEHPRGCLVYLEPLRLDEMIETFGRPGVDHAVRTFAVRLLGQLPAGGLLCRRREGDLVAYLRDTDEGFARRWANEATALASMVPLRTPDGRARIPFGLRAKVARLGPIDGMVAGEDRQIRPFSGQAAS